MLGFLRPKPRLSEPAEFRDDVVIEKSAEHVYAMIDWADSQNAHRRRGHRIEPVEGAPDRFRMTMNDGHTYEMTVTEAVRHTSYVFTAIVMPRVGRMVEAHEQYRLEALSAGSCRLSLVATVIFAQMRPEEFGQELLMVCAACHNGLAKLKIQAEQGLDAVRSVADKLIV